jgi:hypothetical protein
VLATHLSVYQRGTTMMTLRHLSFACAAILPALSLAMGCSGDANLGKNETSGGIETAGNSSGSSTGSGSAGTGSSDPSGSSGTGSGGDTSGAGTGSSDPSGGTGSGSDCTQVQCLRAYECVESCDGPVLSASCCPCTAPTFDRITCDSGAAGAGSGSDPNLEELNTPCAADGTCSEGLTPVKYYGIAGSAGPEFCDCTIPCEEDPNVCPEGTSCVTISDGPGTVCSQN